ncbi:hypothetical protein [Paenibacillus dendritiformis]|nr:hypothetical protein [Paenibacillus dendritiformis]
MDMRVQASSAQADMMMLAGIYRRAAPDTHWQHARARARKRRHDAAKNR